MPCFSPGGIRSAQAITLRSRNGTRASTAWAIVTRSQRCRLRLWSERTVRSSSACNASVVGELAHVVVAGEQLVGALAGEHDLDVLAGGAGEHVVRHRAAHEAGVEGLDRAHDVGERLERLGRRVGDLDVLAAEVLGDLAARPRGRATPRSRPRTSAAAARARSRSATAIAATSEESSPPERKTPTLTSPIICCAHGAHERLARAGRAAPRGPVTGVARRRHRGGEAPQPVLRRPRAAGRERLDERLPLGVEGVHLGREADRSVRAAPSTAA